MCDQAVKGFIEWTVSYDDMVHVFANDVAAGFSVMGGLESECDHSFSPLPVMVAPAPGFSSVMLLPEVDLLMSER